MSTWLKAPLLCVWLIIILQLLKAVYSSFPHCQQSPQGTQTRPQMSQRSEFGGRLCAGRGWKNNGWGILAVEKLHTPLLPPELSSALMTPGSWRGPQAAPGPRQEPLTGLLIDTSKGRKYAAESRQRQLDGACQRTSVRCRCHVLWVWVTDQDYIIPPRCRSWCIDSDTVTCRPRSATESSDSGCEGAGVVLHSYLFQAFQQINETLTVCAAEQLKNVFYTRWMMLRFNGVTVHWVVNDNREAIGRCRSQLDWREWKMLICLLVFLSVL